MPYNKDNIGAECIKVITIGKLIFELILIAYHIKQSANIVPTTIAKIALYINNYAKNCITNAQKNKKISNGILSNASFPNNTSLLYAKELRSENKYQ